jgi:hypothetical protein
MLSYLVTAQEGTISADVKTVEVPVDGLFLPEGLPYGGTAFVTSTEIPSGNLTIYANGFCIILEPVISILISTEGIKLTEVSCDQQFASLIPVQISQTISSSLDINLNMNGLNFIDSFTLRFPLPLLSAGDITNADDVKDHYDTSRASYSDADFGINTTITTEEDQTVINALKEELENKSYLTEAVDNETHRDILIQASIESIQKGEVDPILALQESVVLSETYPKILEMNAVIETLADEGGDISELVTLRDDFKSKIVTVTETSTVEDKKVQMNDLVLLYTSFNETATSYNLSYDEEVKATLADQDETIQELNQIKLAAQKVVTVAQIEQDTKRAEDHISVLKKYGVDVSQVESLINSVNGSKENLFEAGDETDMRQQIRESEQTMQTIVRIYDEQKDLTLRNNLTDIIGRARAAGLKMDRIIKGVREAGIDASPLQNIRNSLTAKVNQLDNIYYSNLSAAVLLVKPIRSDMASFKTEMNRIFERNPSKFGG